MKIFNRGKGGKKISMDELESLKDVLDENNSATEGIPTLSDVVKEKVVQQAKGSANEDYQDRLNASLDELREDSDIPMLTDISEAATPFELVGGQLSAAGAGDDKKDLYAQMELEAERLLDEIVTRHMPLIRDELMVRLEDVKQTLLDELKADNN